MIDREYFIYRIASGKLKFKNLTIVQPSIDLLYEASEIYKKTYENAEAPSEEEMIYYLLDLGYITEEELEFRPNQELKIELLNSQFQSINFRAIKEAIKEQEKKFESIYNRKYQYSNYTKEGIATYAKSYFIVKKTTFNSKKKYDWSKYGVETIMKFVNSQFVSEKKMREISRNDPWLEIWSSAKKGSVPVFDGPAINFTSEQRRLIMWSSLYENIRNAEEPPNDIIIHNDYLLDGWLLSREKENKQKQKEQTKPSKKYKDGQEIFIKVDTPDDAKKVEEMNSYEAKVIKQARERRIKRDGLVFEQNLPDVKRNIQMKLNRMK